MRKNLILCCNLETGIVNYNDNEVNDIMLVKNENAQVISWPSCVLFNDIACYIIN